MVMNDIVSLLGIYSGIALLVFLVRELSGLFNPAKLFTYYWVVQILFITLFYRFFIFQYSGIYFILIAIGLFCIGSIGGKSIDISSLKKHSYAGCNENIICKLLIVLIICAAINPLLSVYRLGFNLSSLLNFNTLLVVNNTASIDRYTTHTSKSAISQIFLCFTYVAPLYGGFVYRLVKNNLKRLSLVTILPAVFVALTQAVKMAFITSVMLWFTGYMVCTLLCKLEYHLNARKALRLAAVFGIFFSVLFISMMFRIGRFDGKTAETVSEKYVGYAFGHLPAFDNWYARYDELSANHTYGAKTFYGISNAIGVLKRKQGIFNDFVRISNKGSRTNVYSLFRLIIEDFGILGSCLFLMLTGFVVQFFYRLVCNGMFPLLSSTFLSLAYFTTFWSFVTSVLAYTSYIAMFGIFYFLIRLSVRYE